MLCLNSPAQPERWSKVIASKASSCCLFEVQLFSQTFSCITSLFFSIGASCSCSFQRSSSVPGWMSRQTWRPNFPSTSSTLTLHSSSLWARQANLWRQFNSFWFCDVLICNLIVLLNIIMNEFWVNLPHPVDFIWDFIFEHILACVLNPLDKKNMHLLLTWGYYSVKKKKRKSYSTASWTYKLLAVLGEK